MQITIVEETPEALPEYEKFRIAFHVEIFFNVALLDKGLGGLRFVKEAVQKLFLYGSRTRH